MPFQLEWKENIMRTESWQLALDHLAKEKKTLDGEPNINQVVWRVVQHRWTPTTKTTTHTNRGMENEKPWTAEAGRRPVGGQNWPRNDHLERRRARA